MRSAPLRAGDVVAVDFGTPTGSEPGFVRPAVVMTSDHVLAMEPRTIHVAPTTTNLRRGLPTEVLLDGVDLPARSAAQVHLCTVISRQRLVGNLPVVNVGPLLLAQIRSVMADLLDLP